MSEPVQCIFCGSALDARHQFICQPCIDRYKQDHSRQFTEARLYSRLRPVRSDTCLVCGDPLHGTQVPVCPWCMERIAQGKEAAPRV